MPRNLNPHLPDPDQFRKWLRVALDSVDLPASQLSRLAGLSINTVGRVIKGGDVTLGTASSLEATLYDLAAKQGKTLPRIIERAA